MGSSQCVYKYYLRYPDGNVNIRSVDVAQGAKVIQVGERDGGVVVWAIVNPELIEIEKAFLIIRTGIIIPPAALGTCWKFLKTITLVGSGFTMHVFISSD